MISIVIVNYNGGRRFIENLRVLYERLPEDSSEVIVVDNASTDESPEAIEREASWVRLVRAEENRGYSAGVNAGAAAAKGDVLVVMNPDAVPELGALDLLCRLVRERREYAILGGGVISEDGRLSGTCFRALPRAGDILREGILFRTTQVPDRASLERSTDDVVETQVVSGSILALTRESYDLLGPMDEGFFLYREDVEWCYRAAEMGKKVGVVPGARFVHAGGASTRAAEGPPLAARVLADFHYFEKTGGATASDVRRRWMSVLRFRALLYRLDAALGIVGRRPNSRRRAAVYRVLLRSLKEFEWSPTSGQAAHPSRLCSMPVVRPRAPGDERPRVLFVIPDMDFGGAQRRIEYLTHGPLAERFDFEVLCLRRNGAIGEGFTRPVPVWEAGVGSWRSLRTWAQARDYCELLDPDIVHSATLPADGAVRIGFRGRVPWVSAQVSVAPWMGLPLRMLHRAAAGRADIIYAVSDDVAVSMKHLSRSGMLPRVVPNPPMIPFAEGPPRRLPTESPVVLLSIGRLAPVKRIDIFLRTAAALERARPGRFRFRVVGEGPMMEELRLLARDLGIGELVEFRGGVSEIAAEYDEADVMLLYGTGEGSPNSVLETLARGRVPLVLRVPGIESILPASLKPCLVDSATPEAFAGRVLDVLDHEDDYLARVAEAREDLGRRRDRFESAMERLYLELLPEASPDPRIRVLHLITRLIVGGAQENTIASVERVDPGRYDSHLWCGPQTGAEGSLFQEARDRGETPRVLPNLVREINPWRDLAVTVQLTRLLRREKFGIVHTHSSKAGIVGRVAARLAGVPNIVHTVHGWGFHEHMNPALRAAYVLLEKLMRPWTNPLVSVSDRTTSVGLKAGIGGPEDYRLIRSGIPLTRFGPDPDRGAEVRSQLGIDAADVVVGSVGRLSMQKNPMDFVRAAEGVLDRHANACFVYVGDGPLRESVEAAAAEMGIAERVRFLGLRSDVPDLLRAMDIFILTSLWEGLPRVVLQALATGLPVVAYDTAGILEAVTEGVNGHMVEPGDVDAMVEILDSLVSDDALRSRMGLAARGLDLPFTEDGMIQDLENLYGELTRDWRV